MTTKKQPDPTLWNLLSAAIACLILVVGCASPTAKTTATNTPTLAAATATPAAATATATAAPPTETATPTAIPVTFEIISGYGNLAQNTDYQQLLTARLQITETVAFAAYNVGGVESLVLLAGEPRDKLTGATIQPLTRLLVAENGLTPLGSPDLVALTDTNGAENVLLAKTAGKELAISGIIAYTNGEHYTIIEKDDGSVVLKNHLDKDNPDAPEYLLETDPDNPKRLVTYINNSPIYIPADWQEPITLTEAGDLFINPFEALKADFVIGNNTEFAQLPEYVELPNGWQVFEFSGTMTNRNTMKIISDGAVAFGPHAEVLVANNNIGWSKVTDPGLGYTMSLKTDENGNPVPNIYEDNSLTLIATFVGNRSMIVWNPETNAWEEEIEEYETAGEALLAMGKIKVFEMSLGTGPNSAILTSYAAYSWKEHEDYTKVTPGPVRSPDNIEPGAIEKTILDFILQRFKGHGGKVAAVNLETGEAEEYQILDNNGQINADIVLISGISEDNPRYVALPPNKDQVVRLFLPGYMQTNSTVGDEFAFWYIQETADQKATIVVYYEQDLQMFGDSWIRGEDWRRIGIFSLSTIVAPIQLLTMPPQEMRDVLSLAEGGRRPCYYPAQGEHGIAELAITLHKLTGSLVVWGMADSQ